MNRFPLLTVVCMALAVLSPAIATSQRAPGLTPMEPTGRPLREELDPRGFKTLDTDTTLAHFTFDNALGGPDTQGWTFADRTAQPGLFFHIDNFAGLGGGAYSPISGAQSLWCGARPCAPSPTSDLCSYATLPGYGNDWDQRFQSTSFDVTGDVVISYDIRYDVESSYDYVHLEYSISPGTWQPLVSYTGSGSESASETVFDGQHGGSLRFRFRVTSDNAWSDEDGMFPSNGAAIIDNLTINDDAGLVDFQDFESEPVGFPFSMDFDWIATIKAEYGIHAALFDGDSVLQEDPVVTNSTNFWGFFNNSSATYACGGHAEQDAVPYVKSIEGVLTGIRNEVRSPEIPYLGVTPGAPVKLNFDVYTDMPLTNLVFYELRVRSKVAGAWKQWRGNGVANYKPEKEWFAHSTTITSLIAPGATSIQVAVGVIDLCPVWCGIHGSGACHSHGPLIDNVRVIVDHAAQVVTNTNDAGPGSLRDAIDQINSFATGGNIRFDIPGSGPFVISLASLLPALGSPVFIDGTTQPGYDGTPLVTVSAPLPGPASVLSFTANTSNNSRVAGLHITGDGLDASMTGISINSAYTTVQRCVISNCGTGIAISGSDNQVGGTDVGDGNTIHDIIGTGIRVTSAGAQRNRIVGNSIHTVTGLGIDLVPDGVTANDSDDADAGANGLQNFPVLSSVSVGSGYTTFFGSLTSTPNTVFRVEFFVSDACNSSGYGNGQTYYGFSNVRTDGSGNTPIEEPFASNIPTGSMITATATDPLGNTSEFSACIPSFNTPSGSSVVTQPVDETTGGTFVMVTFDEVTGDGNTSLVTSDTGPALPGTFDLGDGTYYDLSTTATFTGTFEVCISYNEGELLVPEADLRLLHWDDPVWVDITTSLDLFTNQICGETDHFSPFVLAVQTPTGVGDSPVPPTFALRQNVPNPFNPTTTIVYDVPDGGADVTIRIYDVSGRMVRTLVNGQRPAGTHHVAWDGRNSSGSTVSTGVYFYRMVAGSFVEARRMVLLK